MIPSLSFLLFSVTTLKVVMYSVTACYTYAYVSANEYEGSWNMECMGRETFTSY